MEKKTTKKTVYKITPQELAKKLLIRDKIVFVQWTWDTNPDLSTTEYIKIETED
jgi:hypothetical protein